MAMYNEITVTAELTNTEYMITKNYNLLQNKPQINSVELMGNKSLEDLGINPDAEENVIDVVKVNGSALTPDANKAVNVTVTTGSDNGTVKVNGSDVAVKGLKSAAFTEATAYDAAGSAAEVQGNVDALTVVVNGKVDKVQGKGLSQNDFTNAYKTKLDGIEAGAQVNTVTSVAGKTGVVTLQKSDVGLGNVDNTSDLNKPISTATQTALNGKVDKEAGKGLSTNDYTTADKTKLAGIEAEANKTIVDSVISGTSTNPVQNKVIYDLLNNLLPEATASGNPISIDNASGFNAKSAKVTVLPIQSGSGDPSPTNIRPISGRDSLGLVRTGFNVWDEEWEVGTINISTGRNDASSVSLRSKNYIPINEKFTYYEKSPSSTSIFYYDENKDFLGLITSLNNQTFTPRANAKFIRFVCAYYIRDYSTYKNDICINISDNDKNGTYVQYGGRNDYSTTFPETIYGGEYEFVEAPLKNTWSDKIDLGTLTWGSTSQNRYVAELPNCKETTGDYVNFYSEMFTPKAQIANGNCWINSGKLYVVDTDHTTVSDFTNFVTGSHICYKLATPTTTTLTPQSISLNKGDNVITTDGDNAEVKYSVSLDSLVSN